MSCRHCFGEFWFCRQNWNHHFQALEQKLCTSLSPCSGSVSSNSLCNWSLELLLLDLFLFFFLALLNAKKNNYVSKFIFGNLITCRISRIPDMCCWFYLYGSNLWWCGDPDQLYVEGGWMINIDMNKFLLYDFFLIYLQNNRGMRGRLLLALQSIKSFGFLTVPKKFIFILLYGMIQNIQD